MKIKLIILCIISLFTSCKYSDETTLSESKLKNIQSKFNHVFKVENIQYDINKMDIMIDSIIEDEYFTYRLPFLSKVCFDNANMDMLNTNFIFNVKNKEGNLYGHYKLKEITKLEKFLMVFSAAYKQTNYSNEYYLNKKIYHKFQESLLEEKLELIGYDVNKFCLILRKGNSYYRVYFDKNYRLISKVEQI
ncbi:hypothetical protein [Aureivirga sp. CE67]|uniref:hypothetical protein n=1 Tax=Aureivirga sp. CE67 TaxID=1788983 RepID=UPI0018CA38C7|nr:hypothetical protein [Aureivirga sp. CE67]